MCFSIHSYLQWNNFTFIVLKIELYPSKLQKHLSEDKINRLCNKIKRLILLVLENDSCYILYLRNSTYITMIFNLLQFLKIELGKKVFISTNYRFIESSS